MRRTDPRVLRSDEAVLLEGAAPSAPSAAGRGSPEQKPGRAAPIVRRLCLRTPSPGARRRPLLFAGVRAQTRAQAARMGGRHAGPGGPGLVRRAQPWPRGRVCLPPLAHARLLTHPSAAPQEIAPRCPCRQLLPFSLSPPKPMFPRLTGVLPPQPPPRPTSGNAAELQGEPASTRPADQLMLMSLFE